MGRAEGRKDLDVAERQQQYSGQGVRLREHRPAWRWSRWRKAAPS